jgi:hypothetical protein
MFNQHAVVMRHIIGIPNVTHLTICLGASHVDTLVSFALMLPYFPLLVLHITSAILLLSAYVYRILIHIF